MRSLYGRRTVLALGGGAVVGLLTAGRPAVAAPDPDPVAPVPAASSPRHIGTDPSGYYPVRHVGATGWLLLGALCGHPWRPFLTP
jgi:hypothetical protein